MIQGPSWDLSEEYPNPNAEEIDEDLEKLNELLDQIAGLNPKLTEALPAAPHLTVESASELVDVAHQVFQLADEARPLLRNPLTYASCCLSVDSGDEAAQQLQGRLQAVQIRLEELLEPLSQWLVRVSEEVIDMYLSEPSVAASAFQVHHARTRRHEQLPLEQENLISALSQDGIHAWGKLYDKLSGSLMCEVLVGNESRTMGIAQTSGLLQSTEDHQRKAAWQAINSAWESQQESCAAGLNAMVGWRLELNRKRSGRSGDVGGNVHFLDAPVHMNRISRSTLDTIMGVAEEAIPLARRAALLQARGYGKAAFSPWDLRAPAPSLPEPKKTMTGSHSQAHEGSIGTPFETAIELIAEAYGSVDEEMGDFVHMMARRHWIEGTVGVGKRPGAYCTGFAKSRTPRVYMTYTGGDSDIITLAHELGHAFHSWVMRDLPDSQRTYGMSLAETASTFGETVVRDALQQQAADSAGKYRIAWDDISCLPSFVLNIPTRFEFERNLYEARKKRPLSVSEIKTLMAEAWQKWYGDALSEPDPLFWASKLHFFISELSFYNFPYLFGYLFSMGIYARRERMGDSFYPNYKALLRDTGRMTAEDLARRHLDVDLTQPYYWQDTLSLIEARVDRFESLTDELFES